MRFYKMSLEIVNLLIKQIQFYCAATFNKNVYALHMVQTRKVRSLGHVLLKWFNKNDIVFLNIYKNFAKSKIHYTFIVYYV